MRIAIYARKSTESEDRQVQSLADQIRELKSLAEREGYLLAEVYQESRSAKAPGNRPEFDRLVSEVESGAIDGILTWSINRLSRNPVDGGRIAYLLQTGRLSMIRTIERTYSPDDNALLLSIENGMATAYIQDLSRNVKRGMRGKFERGWHTNRAPIGYKNDAESGHIIADPERFDLVREAWDMMLTGNYSTEQIARALQSKGLTVGSRRGPVNVVSRNTFHRMFRNPIYAGVIRLNGETRQGNHPAMVTLDEFDATTKILERKARGTRARIKALPFQGVFYCPVCGCQVVGEQKTKTYLGTNRTISYTYYHCSGRRGCTKRSVREEGVVELVKTVATTLNISERYSNWLHGTLPQAIERRAIGGPNPELGSLGLEKERARLDALVTLRADGEIGQEEFARNRGQILERIAAQQRILERRASTPARELSKASELLDTIEMARAAVTSPSKTRHVELAKKLGPMPLEVDTSVLKVAPILKRIAAFEPVVLSYQSKDSGDDFGSESVWLGFWDDVLSLLDGADMQ